jgi:hypothetical protein
MVFLVAGQTGPRQEITMTLGIGSFDFEMHRGSLSIQVGKGEQRWDLYWSRLDKELVVCRGMKTVWEWRGVCG